MASNFYCKLYFLTTTNYMYVLYVVILSNIYIHCTYIHVHVRVCLFDLACFFLSSFSSLIKTSTYLDLQQWSLERSLPVNAQLPLKFLTLNYLLWTPAGQEYKDLIILNIHSKAVKQ